jgi:hypothetical protein
LQHAENGQFLAGQDTDEFRTASDCGADPSREFRRLAAMSLGGHGNHAGIAKPERHCYRKYRFHAIAVRKL